MPTESQPIARTFDALLQADLEVVYQQGKDEVLRGRAFRILLDHANTVQKLERLAFDGERGCARWSTRELMDISNRFRLLSSPENEIRLYRECRNDAFRRSPRVREFLVLALNKSGRPAEAIDEAAQIISEGGQNALVWGALGDSHTARMHLAEQLAQVLASPNPQDPIDPNLISQFGAYFPEVAFEETTAAMAASLRRQALAAALRTFRQGFRDSGEPYPGLGWMARTVDQLHDFMAERADLLGVPAWTNSGALARLRELDVAIDTLRYELDCQGQLIGIALALQGGSESRDYWAHAGLLQLAVMFGAGDGELAATTARAIATADASFKFNSTIGEIVHIRDRLAAMRALAQAEERETHMLDAQIARADEAVAALAEGRARFAAGERAISTQAQPADALGKFRANTVNFRTLIGNLIPVFVEGTIGRVGARVPDLLINRRVQADLLDLVEGHILSGLPAEDRTNPRAVIERIQELVGAGLNLGELQDLQSPAHMTFDTRSDGLIALSGVDFDLRKDTQTSTDLTATLLMQTGDCRETMYLNGALFACWQQLQVKRSMARAMLCLEVNYAPGFRRIVREEIPSLMRYELRGGQVDVFVEGIAVQSRYHTARRADDDPSAIERRYGLAELAAGEPLSRYELEQSLIEVTYADGSTMWLDPRDGRSSRRRMLDHVPAGDGGLPVIPGAGDNFANVRALRLLHLVESHALTFLLDEHTGTVELCDGFYNERMFESPYAFSAGAFDIGALLQPIGLVQANTRTVISAEGVAEQRPVYLRFLGYSRTDYATGLVEGDIPDTLQLMGRMFNASFRRERRRMDEGKSPVPSLLRRIEAWQLARAAAINAYQPTLDRQLARLMLDLAKEQPESVELHDVSENDILIHENAENHFVYLVLSGHLHVLRNGQPLRNDNGQPISITAGGVVGEISAMRAVPATASVMGDAAVLRVPMAEIRRQLQTHPDLRRSMDDVAAYRITQLSANGYAL